MINHLSLINKCNMTFLWLLQVNDVGASGVVVDEEGLKALNIDPSSWVCS